MPMKVSCVVKDERYSKYESIQAIGGTKPDGSRWKFSLQEAISAIEKGTYGEFYVERPAGDRVQVIVAERLGKKYLKTKADGDEPNNLLSLPSCP